MRNLRFGLIVPWLSLPVAAVSQGALVYQDVFNGSAETPLNGVAPDIRPGSETWTANEGYRDDGSVTVSSGSAWLPYVFGSGVYEATLSLDLSALPADSTSFASISFTTADPFGTAYINIPGVFPYATVGLRGNRDVELWGGVGNSNNVDGGKLASDVSRSGTLRVVLDTTAAAWTVNGFYIPDGSSEIVLDLNTAGDSVTYTFGANQPTTDLTGVGIIHSNISVTFDQFTFSVVPEPGSFTLFGTALALLAKRRRRCS